MQRDYLKVGDVEALNFTQLKREGDKEVFINRNKYGRDELIHFGELLDDMRYIAVENNCGQFYFMGWLGSKRELKFILKRVEVIT